VAEESGQLIAGRYRLDRCLARGGMGSVWEAQHIELESRVAIKLLRPELGLDEAHIERFRREARAAAKLKSPHVVTIYDCGVDRRVPYIAMEFLAGEDLELRLGRLARLELDEALSFLDQAARGLAVAHAAGLVHRDVKPANLFIERLPHGERIKVVDFGIARPLGGESTLTTGGGVWGSPAYMSPEQARGRAIDQRTDVWALAGVFYRMVTGQLPFSGVTEHDTIVLVCTGQARPPSELDPSLPPDLDAFFARALAKDPEQRIPTVELLAEEAAEALGRALSPFELPPSRPSASPAFPTRSSDPGVSEGRVTETKPLSVGSGPTPITARSQTTPANRSQNRRGIGSKHGRHIALGLLAAASVLIALLFWTQARDERPSPPGNTADSAAAPTPAMNAPLASSPGPEPPSAAGPASLASESNEKLGGRRPDVVAAPRLTPGQSTRRPNTQKGEPTPTEEPSTPTTSTDPLFGLPLKGDDPR